MHGAFMTPLGWARCGAGLALGLLVDFFAEDPCRLCGRTRSGARSPSGGAAAETHPAHLAALTAPVTVSVCGIRFKNHPVCRSCAGEFESARTAGLLGAIMTGGQVMTTAGDRFGAGLELPPARNRVEALDDRTIAVIAPYMTNDNVLQIVHLAKYKGVTSLLDIMVRAIVGAIRRFGVTIPDNAVLVPVPIFPGERRRLDHTGRICASLSDELSLPVDAGNLRKIRFTGSQSRTRRQDRAENVRTAFSASCFADYHVFLVDDVVTSGSTAGACSAAVASAGAQSVTLLCFGRAL